MWHDYWVLIRIPWCLKCVEVITELWSEFPGVCVCSMKTESMYVHMIIGPGLLKGWKILKWGACVLACKMWDYFTEVSALKILQLLAYIVSQWFSKFCLFLFFRQFYVEIWNVKWLMRSCCDPLNCLIKPWNPMEHSLKTFTDTIFYVCNLIGR